MFDRHIFVIGMPGSGKSSLSKRVAGNLGIPYLDIDTYIQQVAGCTVSEFFAQYGEAAFRTAETNVLVHLAQEPPCLVSTGGGCIMRDINRTLMRNHGLILLIDRPLEEIMGDIKLDRRPLLAQKGLGEVERLYHERIDTYRSAADLVLQNNQGYQAGVYNMEQMIRSTFGI